MGGRAFGECKSGSPININLSHEDRHEAGRPVGVIFMVTRRGWGRGPAASRGCHAEPQRSISHPIETDPRCALGDTMRHLRLMLIGIQDRVPAHFETL